MMQQNPSATNAAEELVNQGAIIMNNPQAHVAQNANAANQVDMAIQTE